MTQSEQVTATQVKDYLKQSTMSQADLKIEKATEKIAGDKTMPHYLHHKKHSKDQKLVFHPDGDTLFIQSAEKTVEPLSALNIDKTSHKLKKKEAAPSKKSESKILTKQQHKKQ